MAYNKAFNTPLVVFTAYNGDMVSDIPLLTWTRKSPTALGLPSNTSYAYLYSSGTSFLAEGYANSTGNFAYYDPATKTWIPSFTTNADVQYQGNGVYLFVNGASVYSSFDGKTLNYAGYLPGLGNPVMCGASNGTYGVLSAWWVHSPMYAKGNVGTGGSWTLTGDFYEDDMCCFTSMTCHRGMYIGIASDTIADSGLGGIQISSDGYHWRRTMEYPYDHSKTNSINFSSMRSVGGKLFLINARIRTSTDVYYQLCVLNGNGCGYTIVRESTSSVVIPSLFAMVYVDKLGQFLHFGDNVIYASADGFRWKAVPQKNFGGAKSNAIYVPGDGFYVTSSGSWGSNSILYCAYP